MTQGKRRAARYVDFERVCLSDSRETERLFELLVPKHRPGAEPALTASTLIDQRARARFF
eukprot:gene29705-55150_t